MRQLLQAGAQAHTAGCYIHTGDLNWWLFYPPFGSDLFSHTLLWDDPARSGSLLGWMMVDPTWPSFEVFLQPDLLGTALAGEIYVYAEEQAFARSTAGPDKPIHKMWVSETDNYQRQHLESRGYSLALWNMAFELSLDQPVPTPSLPDGNTLRPCRGLPELEQRAAAQYAAFGGTVPMEQYLNRFRTFFASQAYAQALDMVVASPDGRIAAFCIAWSDEVTRTAHFEPVGTHPDFQRQGLGKAVLRGALQRLQQQGMLQATVVTPKNNTPAVALYLSVGFEPLNRLGHYTKVSVSVD